MSDLPTWEESYARDFIGNAGILRGVSPKIDGWSGGPPPENFEKLNIKI